MAEENVAIHPYLCHTPEQRAEMLKAIGVDSFQELIRHIPEEIRAQGLELSSGLSELDLELHVTGLSQKNRPASETMSFLGGGSYYRFVPAALSAIVSRSEFATAYTPYQPEVSQGSLQAIYEFQTAICLLTGMDVSNASLYDGPTALAEAALMAHRLTGRKKLVLADSLNPEYAMVTGTYARSCGLIVETIRTSSGVVEGANLELDSSCAALIVAHPNYFGCLEDLEELGRLAHREGSQFIVVTEPVSLGILTPPGEFQADMVVGDAQPCGNQLSFGGPSAGYLATRQEYVRQLPGRLAGVTVDNRGQRAFTLTLQTREQHIRRSKATSNICTNQALNALTMLVYLSLMGPRGLRELCLLSVQRAHYLADKLCQIAGVGLMFQKPYFNEFALTTPMAATEVLSRLKARGILGGVPLERFYPDLKNTILVAVTEMNSPEQLELYAESLSEALSCQSNQLSGNRRESFPAAPHIK